MDKLITHVAAADVEDEFTALAMTWPLWESKTHPQVYNCCSSGISWQRQCSSKQTKSLTTHRFFVPLSSPDGNRKHKCKYKSKNRIQIRTHFLQQTNLAKTPRKNFKTDRKIWKLTRCKKNIFFLQIFFLSVCLLLPPFSTEYKEPGAKTICAQKYTGKLIKQD